MIRLSAAPAASTSPRATLRTIRVHVLGAGPVGRAFLRLAAEDPCLRIVALSDSTATLYDRDGLDALALARHKQRGAPLAERPGARVLEATLAVDLVAADVVVDATATRPDQPDIAAARCRAALRAGSALALAAKDAALVEAVRWRTSRHAGRIGLGAVLGGTGAALTREASALVGARSIALVANASTTAVIEAIERGASLEEGVAQARAAGVLEADARLDLDGTDAAVKLAVTAGWLWGTVLDPARLVREPLASLDADAVRGRARQGLTTRLVARARRDGRAGARYEVLPRTAALAVPSDRVAYTYRLSAEHVRLHVGQGLGADGTARALLADTLRLAAKGGAQ